MPFCNDCGVEINDDAKFCSNCGSKTNQDNWNLDDLLITNLPKIWSVCKSIILFALGSILIAFLIDLGVNFYTKNNDKLNNNFTEVKEAFIDIFKSKEKESKNHQTDFPITKEAEYFIKNSLIIKSLNLDSNTKNTLLEILSDTNPDPNNNQGKFCENTTTRCKYCNILVPGYLKSYQRYLNETIFHNDLLEESLKKGTNPNNIKYIDSINSIDWSSYVSSEQYDSIDWEIIRSEVDKKNLLNIKPIIIDICLNYRKGMKYICLENPIVDLGRNFCSEKCKTEYKYSH